MTDEQIEAGIALRDEGMMRATKRACGEEPEWPERALSAFHAYAKGHEFFTTEDVVAFAREQGLETPESRAWGSVARRAMLRGMVTHTGRYVASINPCAHRGPKAVWGSRIYKP